MNFYITDRKYNLIDIVSTDGNTDIVATVIKDTQSIEESARDFEATFYFKDDDFKLAKKLSTVGNFVLYKDREGQSVFITIESREINATDCLVQITGKDASIDLINEVVAPYKPDKSYSIAEYILRFTSDSGFEIGENAIPDKKLKLEEWTSEATALERILSVATRFEVEISFSFEINGLDVIKRYINISEKRGSDENITLYANREIESITIKEDSYDLFTAIKPIGAIPEGKETPINLNNYKYTDPNGRYVLSGGILKDNKVVQEWSRLLSNEVSNPTSAHITRYKEYDTDSQSKLFTMAMTDLKKYAQLNVNYDVAFYEFPTTVSIGDTINIVDEDKEIYLSARVLTLTYDYISDTAEAVVGDYLIKDSGISKDLENLAASMKDKFANVNENLNGKAVIVKSDTAPEPNENTIWIDTSHPQTPIKTYDPETGEWLVSTGEAGKDGIAGKDGLGVLSTVITYAISASGTTTPSGGWTAQVPTLEKGKYLWTKTQWTYTDGSTENGYTVSYIAKDGNDGEDGYAGKDGVGISNTKVEYVGSTSGTTRPTSGWSTTIPTVAEGNFLWTRITWTYTDNTSEMGYSVAKMGAKGDKGNDGIAGKDGVGIKSTQIMYAQSTSGTTAPSSGWTAEVPTLIKGQYLWTQTTWVYTDNTGEAGYTVSYNAKDGNNGTDGIAGKDGVGIASTLIQYVGSTNGTTKPTSGWTTTIPTVAEGNYLWTKTTWTYTDGTKEEGFSVAKMGAKGDKGDTGAKGADGIAGKDGVGLKETVIRYAGSSNGTTAPSSGWQSTVPVVSAGNFLWTRTTWTYTDNTSEVGYSVSRIGADGNNGEDGIAGKDGTGIKSTTITYVGSTNGTTPPSSGWTTTIPTVADGSYLWTKTVWLYTDNTSETGYSVAKMGAKGADGKDGVAGKDGVGIKTTTIQYASSTSGTTAPTTGWQTNVPTVAAGNYLWTKNTWTYTDNTTEVGYAVSRIGKDGNTGKDGIAGKDGTGIKATSIQYAGSTSGTTPPTTGWTASVPTVASGSYLWTKTTWSYTDDTNETGYSVSRMGETGAKGDKGDSATSYWITPSVNTIQISATKVLNPTTITFTGYSKTGTANAGLYDGRFNILTSVDGIVYSSKYSSSANQSAYTYTVPADVKFIKAKMYQAGGFTALVDEVTIPIIESAEGLMLSQRNLILDSHKDITNTNYLVNQYKLDEDWIEGEQYTFVIKGTVASGQTFGVWMNGASNRVGSLTEVYSTGIYYGTFTAVAPTSELNKRKVNLYNTPSNTTSATVDWVALYKGNKPFDWTPALGDAMTYKRYANSEDGTVDFTGDYPKENLLEDSISMSGFSTGTLTENAYLDTFNSRKNTRTIATQTSPIIVGQKDITELLKPSTTYTVSFVARGNFIRTYAFPSVNAKATGSAGQSTNSTDTAMDWTLTSDWKEYSYTFTTLATLTGTKYLLFRLDNSSVNTNAEIARVKLEEGNKTIYTSNQAESKLLSVPQYVGIGVKDTMVPSDFTWTINPEYTQARTDVGLDTKVDDETFNDAQDHINEQIDSKASSDELQALAELTDNLKESYEGFMSDGGKYEADLQALEARATGLLLDLEDKVLDLDFLKTRMRLGEEGFEIGAEDSSMKMLLTNDRLSFMDSGKEIAFFSNQQFKINRGAILESIQIGSHKITKISDKMTVIQFTPPNQ